MEKVRVRFAPSPTGPLHIGGVRTALFNYLFARRNGGDFLLRIEDTDRTRYVSGAEQYIIDALQWCGLTPDEGPGFGGNCGPYRQSDRQQIYRQYAMQLLASGWAYYAFDTPDALDALRKAADADRRVFSYDAATRTQLQNSLTLPPDVVQCRIDSGEPWVIRFRMPENTDVTGHDMIRGNVTFNTAQLDDKVLFKSDGMPTYHLANVVDDHLMHITHVIRGEEWLSSMPLHILLYEALGWADSRPQFAHLPLILKPSGQGKLSKRDGDKFGFPVFPLLWTDPADGTLSRGYREDGYFPEAVVNMLALLGWNAGTDQEIFSMDELIASFSFERVVKSGARFDPEKTKWFNHQYMLRRDDAALGHLLRIQLQSRNLDDSDARLTRIAGLVKDRCTFPADLWTHSFYFYEAPAEYDMPALRKKWDDNTHHRLSEITQMLEQPAEWNYAAIKNRFSDFMNARGWNFGQVMVPIRVALVGSSQGLDLFLILELLGQEETVVRMRRFLDVVNP
ncbi:MAG: glutamate--tRNA ligase [Bacteroidales bacterium]|nr:glutamate--tRNA ligase [Bacteroidales bacterium]